MDEERASGGPGAAPGEAGEAAEASEPSAPTPAFDALGQLLPASSFAPGLDDAALGFLPPAPPVGPVCGWCGAALPAADLEACPTCGAALKPPPDLPDIPGLTVAPVDIRAVVRDVSPEIRALVAPAVTDELAIPGTRPELSPPDPAIRRAMLEMELQARSAPPAEPPAEDGAASGGEAGEPEETEPVAPGAADRAGAPASEQGDPSPG